MLPLRPSFDMSSSRGDGSSPHNSYQPQHQSQPAGQPRQQYAAHQMQRPVASAYGSAPTAFPPVGGGSSMAGSVGPGMAASTAGGHLYSGPSTAFGPAPGRPMHAMDAHDDAYQHDQPPGPPASASAPKPIRRRMRMITSCLECRRRKLKCNKSQPCSNCIRFNRDCVYLGPKLDEASQLRLTEIKEKVGSLERQLERDVAKTTTKAATQQRILADDVEGDYDEESELEITPMVALDLTYEDDADGTDDIIDLGIQVGRMRITERIGGLNRPRLSEEVCMHLWGITFYRTSHYRSISLSPAAVC